MTEQQEPKPGRTSGARARAEARIVAPVKPLLRRAAVLSVLAGLLWPVQAGLIAATVAGWAAGQDGLDRLLLMAAGVLAAGVLRAGLDRMAGGLLFRAADQTVARERAALIAREARAPAASGSAAVAALAVQKLPLLQPWITRYHVAMTRVSVLPLALAAIACWQSWIVACILLVAGPLIPVFMALVGMAAEEASRRQMLEIGSMNAMLMERLAALTDIRLLGAEARAAGDFSSRAESLRQRTMAVLRVAFLSSTVLELFSAIGVAMVAVFVGFSLLGVIRFGAWGTPMTLGEGVFVLLLAPEFFQPLRDLAAAWHDRAGGYAVVEDLDALDAEGRAEPLGSGHAAEALRGAMALRLDAAVADLPGLALALPALAMREGEAVALVGPSGAGKSTTLAAVAGLVPLASGRIEVAGQTLDAATADAWRARLAHVPQAPHFGDRPLGEWLDPRGSGADPWPALEAAQAGGIVRRLPDGLATRLGESGGGVSGGEARRLLLARAILAGGDLVLADEPTADLDPETAQLVTGTLLDLRARGRSLLIATHDPELAARMDRVVEVTA